MDDWISKAVLTTTNRTIQGTVYARNAIISYVEALGLVNNIAFDSQNILLKSASQRLTGALTIGDADANKFGPESMTPLTFDNLLVNSLNAHNVSDFFANLILYGNDGIGVGELYTNLEFMDRLDIDDLIVRQKLNGTTLN